jgi:hypothetical protein
MDSSPPQHLIVILDAQYHHWQTSRPTVIQATSPELTLTHVFGALNAFKRALELQHCNNKFTLYLANGSTSGRVDSDFYQHILQSTPGNGGVWRTTAQALCYLHKNTSKARLLIIQKQVDSQEYHQALSVMVAAQQINTTIDGIGLGECEMLPQVCAFTDGIYIRQGQRGLLQTLFQVFLPIKRPKMPANFQLRPHCNCCNRQVDKAYVCSSCLALYCNHRPYCESCRCRFLV